MAVLHPLECYLLETFSSAEYIATTRDAVIELIDAHEAAFDRIQREPDPRNRSKPLLQAVQRYYPRFWPLSPKWTQQEEAVCWWLV